MMYKHVGRILFFMLMIAFMPLRMMAATTTPEGIQKNICASTLSSVFVMARSAYTSASVAPGNTVEIPLTLKNQATTPLNDIHLFMRVVHLGKATEVVALTYDPTPFAFAPGASATTTIGWTTAKHEAAGFYRVDVFVLPSADYANPQVGIDTPAPTSVFVEVTGKDKVSMLSIQKDAILVNHRVKYDPTHPILFEEREPGEVQFAVRNSSTHPVQAEIGWKLYEGQQVSEQSVLYASSSALIIPANGSSIVSFSVPVGTSSRSLAVLDLTEHDQHVLMPILFYRTTSGPVPLNVFGAEQPKGSMSPFDLREGKPYTLFACPAAVSMLHPTILTFAIHDAQGSEILTREATIGSDTVGTPIQFSFVAPRSSQNARLLLTSSSGGQKEMRALTLSCGDQKDGDCTPIPPWSASATTSTTRLLIGLLLALIIGFGLWNQIRKHAHHA